MKGPSTDADCYPLELAARITGVSVQAILHYQAQGLVRALPLLEGLHFDDEGLRTLRRIEHLRRTYEVNDNGLRLILHLMDEIERLQLALR